MAPTQQSLPECGQLAYANYLCLPGCGVCAEMKETHESGRRLFAHDCGPCYDWDVEEKSKTCALRGAVRVEMKSVESEVIAAFGYNPDSGLLIIDFRNGSRYEYYLVPRAVVEEFDKAVSKGTFFRERIEAGNFAYKCLRPRGR